MEEPIEKEEYKGYTIKIYPDFDPLNPREMDDYLMGTMVCFHRRYELGDKHDLNSDNFSSWDEIAEYLVKEEKAILIYPLYLYDHSGLRMKIGSFYGLLPQGHAEFDSGQVGFIYTTKQRIRDMYGIKHVTKEKLAQADKELHGEVETYDAYISGQVYGYYIEDAEGDHVDSCWGYYGYEGYQEAMKRAKDIIDHRHQKRLEEIAEAHEVEIGI